MEILAKIEDFSVLKKERKFFLDILNAKKVSEEFFFLLRHNQELYEY